MAEPLIVFDTETIPDAGQHEGDGFPKPTFHQIVAISLLEAHLAPAESGSFYVVDHLRSGGEINFSEAQLLKGFFAYVEKKKPRLVTFNGRGFDLPVLKYRAMKHEVSAPWFSTGDSKWENYSYRFSVNWHCDLMDALSDFGAAKPVSMADVCGILGIPGKLGMDGSQVKEFFEAGKLSDIRDYCETDVVSTYLIFLRYALFRGELTAAGHAASVANLRTYLEAERTKRQHLGKFVDAWAKLASAAQIANSRE